MKAAAWGDVAQQGTVTNTQFAGALGYGVDALESSTTAYTGSITGSTPTWTGIGSTADIVVGQSMGAGLSTVASVVSATSITQAANAGSSSVSGFSLETLGTCHTNGNGAPIASANIFTTNCRSRYGAADMVGNVHEWTSGQNLMRSGFDNGVDALWLLQGFLNVNAVSFGTKYDLLRAIPGPSVGPTVSPNGDFQNLANSPVRGAYRGGGYNSGTAAGRWYVGMYNTPSYTNAALGGRCSR